MQPPTPPTRLHPLPQPAEEQRLFKGGVALEEEKTLAELNVANDDELAVAYKLEGGCRAVDVPRLCKAMASHAWM